MLGNELIRAMRTWVRTKNFRPWGSTPCLARRWLPSVYQKPRRWEVAQGISVSEVLTNLDKYFSFAKGGGRYFRCSGINTSLCLYPLDARVPSKLWQPEISSDMGRCPHGGKILLVWHPYLRELISKVWLIFLKCTCKEHANAYQPLGKRLQTLVCR